MKVDGEQEGGERRGLEDGRVPVRQSYRCVACRESGIVLLAGMPAPCTSYARCHTYQHQGSAGDERMVASGGKWGRGKGRGAQCMLLVGGDGEGE